MTSDPLGRILTEVRDDPAVAAITDRVRGGEPAPGDAIGPPYQPFVLLTRYGATRLRRAPVQEVMVLAKCYERTPRLAAILAGAVADAAHARGHRVTPSGVVIFGSFVASQGAASFDIDTHQPYEPVLISVGALTVPIA